MYADAALLYDVIHDARGREANAEADLIVGEIERRCPSASSLLDVACGTGAHLPRFASRFEVVGVDLSPKMLAIASARVPGTRLVEGDFRTFDLGSTFDAVVSLFSGIGYLTEEADLRTAIANMARHLEVGGVLLVEGWVEPAYWIGSTVNAEAGQNDEVAVARAVRSRRVGPLCHIAMRYVAATPGELVTVDEQHVMRLSEPAEFASAYEAAGLSFERLPHMLHPGRAVYAGIRHQ
jgi:SAM-dependent methyltransferase